MPDWQLHVILLAALLTANCSLASSPSVPPSTKPESTVQLMRQTSNDTSWQLNELASWRSRRSSSSSVELEPSEGQLESSGDNLRYSSSVTVILSVAYTMIFVVGIVGNSLVVAIVCKSPRMRTVTNYFIVNLAFADILVLLFCLPATLIGNLFIRKCPTLRLLFSILASTNYNANNHRSKSDRRQKPNEIWQNPIGATMFSPARLEASKSSQQEKPRLINGPQMGAAAATAEHKAAL